MAEALVLQQHLSPLSDFKASRAAPTAPSFVSLRALPASYFRPTLVELCVPILARQRNVLPLLASIPPAIRSHIISKLPLDLPLDLCTKFIIDDEYWKRRSILKWKTCDPSCHGRSWKQLFFERNLADALESFDPTLEDGVELEKLLETSKPFVHNLAIRQLPSHLSASVIFHALGRQLTALKLEYGWRNARMLYEPAKFGMKISDCMAFSASLSIATALTDLDLSCNLLDDTKIKILLKGMLLNPILIQLNLAHNRIGDVGVAELSKYLASEKCVLSAIDLGDNYFLTQGAKSLAEALMTNGMLACMNLGYNNLGDDGGRAIFDALHTNTALQRLIIGSCGLGEETAMALGRLISSWRSPLLYLDMSANPSIGTKGGATLQTSMDGGKPPSYLDLQLCGVGNEVEQFIANVIKTKNDKKLRQSLSKTAIFQI